MRHVGHAGKANHQARQHAPCGPAALPPAVYQAQRDEEHAAGHMAADKGAVVVALVGDHGGTAEFLRATKVFHLVGAGALPVLLEAPVHHHARPDDAGHHDKRQRQSPGLPARLRLGCQPAAQCDDKTDPKHRRNPGIDPLHPPPVARLRRRVGSGKKGRRA